MAGVGERWRRWVPASMAARGTLLLVVTVLAVLVPGLCAHWVWSERAAALACQEREALLGVVLATFLEHEEVWWPGEREWLEPVYAGQERVRWAGVFHRDGREMEFRRRIALPITEIRTQVEFGAGAEVEPLRIDGVRSRRFVLVTVPRAEGEAVMAAILDREGLEKGGLVATLGGLGFAAVLGLVLAGAWFRFGIQRPIERLGQRLVSVHEGLVEVARQDLAPRELAAMVDSMEQTRKELRQWRTEATYLRHTFVAQVNSRTRAATQAQREAERDAGTDALTRLENRRAFERVMPKLFAEKRARGAELSVIVFDVDHFKPLNDVRGHQEGDVLLAFVGELLRSAVRRGVDRAVRVGGDEFVLLLPDTTALEARAVAERLVAMFAQRAKAYGDLAPRPGLSAGVASLGQHGAQRWEELLKMADAAMYESKRSGAGVRVYGEGSRDQGTERTRGESARERGIERSR